MRSVIDSKEEDLTIMQSTDYYLDFAIWIHEKQTRYTFSTDLY